VRLGDGGRAVDVLHLDDECLVAVRVLALIVDGDEALGLEDGGNAELDGGVRGMALLHARLAGVAQVREEIADRVCHLGCFGTVMAARVISDPRVPGVLPG